MMHNLPDAKPCNLWKEALIGVILACICAALICPVCLAQSGDAKGLSPRSVDIIHLSGGDSGYPTPFMHYPRGPGIYKMNLIFDCLIERDDKGLIPWLAESWDISSDGKEYTFHLRDDVNWLIASLHCRGREIYHRVRERALTSISL